MEERGLISRTTAGDLRHINLELASLVLTSDCLFCGDFNHLKGTFQNYILGLHLHVILVSSVAFVELEKTTIPACPWAKRFPILPAWGN